MHSRGNTIAFMPECGFDFGFGKGRIFLLYLPHSISFVAKFLHGVYSNPGAGYDPGVMADISRPYYRPCSILVAFPQRCNIALGLGNDHTKRDSNYILLADDFAILYRFRLDKDDATIQDKEFSRPPLFLRHLRKFLGNLAKMLQRNTILIAEDVEHAQGNDVREGIDAAERNSSVLFCKRGPEETGAIPVSKLSLRDSGKPLYLVFAKGRNDHRSCRLWIPSLQNHMLTESGKSKPRRR